MNSWDPNIIWKISGIGNTVQLLDLNLQLLSPSELKYSTYRKPEKTDLFLHRDSCHSESLFLPRDSCHPESVFAAIAIGEATRYMRTKSAFSDVLKQIVCLISKLVLRGYSRHECRRAASLVLSRPPKSLQNRSKVREVCLKATFSRDLNRRFLQTALNKHAHVLKSAKPSLALSVQPSLFRLVYRQNWSRLPSTRRAGGARFKMLKTPQYL